MEEKSLHDAQIRALEYQRTLALTEWAKDRASLEVALAVATERDARIAELEAQLGKLLSPKE